MYNQNNDNYIRNLLGYNLDNNAYVSNNMNPYEYNSFNMSRMDIYNNMPENFINLEEYYPDIYNIVYPMIQKEVNENNRTINNQNIEAMVDRIYYSIEMDESFENRSSTVNQNEKKEDKSINKQDVKKEDRNIETRHQNSLLKDLIKILLLRELIRKPGRPGNNSFRPMNPGMPGIGCNGFCQNNRYGYFEY